MIDYRKILKNQEFRLRFTTLFRFLPDKQYLKLVYRVKVGKKLNLKHPKGFNEKLQWLKVYRKHPEYTDLSDKIKVRDHVAKIIGEGHTFPLLGAWERFEDIPFDTLPDRFVLKCSHDSGSVRIIRDKSSLTDSELKKMKKFYRGRMKLNPYLVGREYPYKNVKPYIIAEPLIEPKNGNGLNDYKFFCFNGVPKLMFIVTGRYTEKHEDFYDMDFNHLPIENGFTPTNTITEKPAFFDEMKEMAAKLSQGIDHVRMDFYEVDGKIYFGEYTFYSAGGFMLFEPEEWENKLGSWIEIDET